MTGKSPAMSWADLRLVVTCPTCPVTLGRTGTVDAANAVVAHHKSTRGHTALVEPVTPPGKAAA